MKSTDKYINYGAVAIMLLVGLHIAPVAQYYQVINNNIPPGINRDLQIKLFNQFAVFVIVGSILTFVISLILLINFFKTSKARIILTTANLVFEFAIGVVVAINISTFSISRQFEIDNYNIDPLDSDSDLSRMYYLSMADTVITFVFEVVFLAFFYYSTLKNTLDDKQMGHNSTQNTLLSN